MGKAWDDRDLKRFLGSEAVRDRHDDEASDDALYTNMSSKVHLEECGRHVIDVAQSQMGHLSDAPCTESDLARHEKSNFQSACSCLRAVITAKR